MTVVAGIAAALAPAGAAAGPLVAPARSCDEQTLSRPFTPWLDPFRYTMPEGSSFEEKSSGWALSGRAGIVSGNEDFKVHGSSDSRSLSLPAGSSATSSTICVGLEHPTLRFFARNTGSLLSALRVDVRFVNALGTESRLPIGIVAAGKSWQPTLPYPVVANLLPLLPGERTPVAFVFTPVGLGGGWQIDDVYVDPYRRS